LQDALEVDAFAQSEEAFAAEALFDAYRSGSAEDIQLCISKKSIFFDLDNNVSFPGLACLASPFLCKHAYVLI